MPAVLAPLPPAETRPVAPVFDLCDASWVDQVQPVLVRVLERHCGFRGHDLEDAVQDALLKIYQRLDRFDPTRGVRFSTWCSVIALNCGRDVLRRRRLPLTPLSTDLDIEDGGLAPLVHAHQQEFAAEYRQALQQISDDHRELLELREDQELGYGDIGRRTGLSLGTIKSRISRARDALRRRLAHYDVEAECAACG